MFKQFMKYTIPSALAMFTVSLYAIVDGIFVGKGIGPLALAAVNIALPFVLIVYGTTTMFAIGGGSLASKNLGSGNKEKALYIFRQITKFMFYLTILITILGVIFAKKLAILLGATDDILPYATDYLRFYIMFCIPNLVGTVLNSFVRNDGNPKLAMIATIAGAICNVILDYVFIFPMNLGIKGAALATGLGQVITIVLVLPHFMSKRGELTFGKSKFDFTMFKEVCRIGTPSFLAQITFAFMILTQNLALSNFVGNLGLAAFSIINYICTNTYMVLIGIAFGVQPLISYNFGAKNKNEIFTYYKMTIRTVSVLSVLLTIVYFIWGKYVIAVFTSDNAILNSAYNGLNYIDIGFIACALNLAMTIYYQAIEMTRLANLICILKSIIFMPIIVVILGNTIGINGIWISFFIAEALTYIIINVKNNIKKNTLKAIDISSSLN